MNGKTGTWLDRFQAGLIVAGIGIAGYLTYVKLFGLKPYCADLGNCDAVQNSAYAEFFGIPVAVLGLLTYAALLVLWWVKRADWRGLGYPARLAFFFVSLIGVLFSAYLTYLEIWVIHEICPWCVASAIVMACLFVLILVEVIRGDDEEEATRALAVASTRERK
jgi:uncharacterized membrane protein